MAVIPPSATLTPLAPTSNVEPFACTATVAVVEPSYVKSAIPLPSVKSGKSVVPTNAPVNEPVKLPVNDVSATALSLTNVVNPENAVTAEPLTPTDVPPIVTVPAFNKLSTVIFLVAFEASISAIPSKSPVAAVADNVEVKLFISNEPVPVVVTVPPAKPFSNNKLVTVPEPKPSAAIVILPEDEPLFVFKI